MSAHAVSAAFLRRLPKRAALFFLSDPQRAYRGKIISNKGYQFIMKYGIIMWGYLAALFQCG
jgi:hypothetical protein